MDRTPKRLLLLGAGFSYNWGGPLASEMLPRLLASRAVDTQMRTLMLQHRHRGFEHILGLLQADQAHKGEPSIQLRNFERALEDVFMDLHTAYSRIPFNWSQDATLTVTQFLTRFDAIFTLNQDTLLETHYLNENVCLACPERRWDGWAIPGMSNRPEGQGYWLPTPDQPQLSARLQPYIKLHGSTNWRSSSNANLLVMGDNKDSAIGREPVLAWNYQTFAEKLQVPNTRLVVIGYSFRDPHINRAICDAVQGRGLTIFVIDPAGLEVVDDKRDENRRAAIPIKSKLAETLQPWIHGASTRPLRSTFSTDIAEHEYLMRFLLG